MDEYVVGMGMMGGRWVRGPSLKAFHMCNEINVRILFQYSLSEILFH